MKRIFQFRPAMLALATFVFFVMAVATALAQCTPPPAGMVGWWKGDGSGADFFATNNGTLANATYTNGVVGQAFSFDPENLAYGTYSGLQIADRPAYALTNALTIEGWVRPRGNGNYIFFRGDGRPGLDPYGLSMQGNNTMLFQITDANGNGAQVGTTVNYNTWTHIAAVLDGVAGTISIYTNGLLAAQQTTTVRPFAQLDPGSSPGVGIGNLNDGFNNFPFIGDIDEIALYGRALSSGEINSIYNAGSAGKCTTSTVVTCTPPAPNLVSWWPGGGNANDIAGMNNGTLSASGAGYASGKVGQGFRFDGTNGYLQIPDADSLKPANVTCEAWVWLDPVINPNTDPRGEYIIFKKNSWDALFEGYSLLKESRPNGDGTYSERFSFVVSRNGAQVITYSTTAAQRGVWYHVAGTYDGNTATLVVNGVAEASAVAGFALDYGTRPVFIGTSGQPAPYQGMFAGIIDEPSIYGRALSTNELAAIYNAGSAGKCSGSVVLTPPTITAQPTNLTVTVNNTAVFGVAATGSTPLSYQWSFNGTNILGATNTTLTLNNVSPLLAGNYSVVVTNLAGVAASSNALLTVYVPPTPPFLISQTPSQVVLLNNSATFLVNVGGSTPLNYFWFKNNVLIPGATNFFYTIPSAQFVDSGKKFSCLITNAYGSVSSTNASLKVIDTIANDLCSGAILITNANYTNAQSTARASSYGDPMPDCVDGFGNGVWYQFTAPVSGLLDVDTYGSDFDTGLAIYAGSCGALTQVDCNDDTDGFTSELIIPTTAGVTYYFLVGGYNAHVGNLVLHSHHFTPPQFDVQPTNIAVIVSSNGTFSAAVSGTQPIALQWFFNNTLLANGGRISGATNTALNIANVITNDGGNYFVVASNWVGVTTSSVAVLTPVILPPSFKLQPIAQSVVTGSNVVFTAAVAGTAPFSYQWYLEGTLLTDDGHYFGTGTPSLTISNLTTADNHYYSLVVTNVSGSVTSTPALLTILVPPSITLNPIGRSVPPGLPTTFNALGTGNPTPVFQWQLNGTNIPGATSTAYGVTAVGSNDLGFYSFVASNIVGVVTSSVAQLTFGPVAVWGRNLNNESLPPPGLTNVVAISGTYGAGFAVRADGSVIPWGGSASQPNVTNIPAIATNVVAIATSGTGASAVLRADGQVVGWNIQIPALSNCVAVAMGNNFGVALRAEGTVVGWGVTAYSTPPVTLNNVKAIACGNTHTVALKNDGTVVTWGSGAGTNVPAGLSGIIAIAAGSTHSLALRTNGTVIAWGSGAATNLPTVASGLTNIIALSASSYTDNQSLCLALRADGVVIGWGTSTYGENIPPSALKSLFSVSAVAAPSHGLALVNDGTPQFIQPPVGLSAYTARNVTLSAKAVGAAPLVYQWLLNGGAISGATNATLLLPNIQPTDAGNYQLLVTNLLGSVLSLPATVNVISNSPLVFLSQTTVSSTNVYQGGVVRFTAGALQGSGPVRYQWFYSPTNKNYSVIPNVTNDTLSLDPALVAQSGSYYVAVSNSVGGITSAPVTLRVQFAKTWGYLAADPPTNLVVSNAIAVAVGNSGRPSASGHYLALRSDGKITPWAATVDANTYGQTNVSPLTNFIVTAVAAGYQDSLALKSDGTVYAWGLNQYGETNVPSSLASGGVTAIACGDYHDLALKSDGTIVGWGQNTYLQTSNAAATNVVAVAASGNNSMILRADGTVVNWGGYSTIPGYPQLNAASLTNIIAIACGNSHFIALRANGTVVSWGDTTYGQVSTAGWSNIVAIAAAGTHSLGLRNDGTVVSSGAIAYPYTANSATNAPPTDLANVVAISAGGDHDVALFGARAPVFTVQPWNRAVTVSPAFGTSFTLVGKVAGVQPMSYQWRLNGTNYPGATNDTFVWRDSQHPAGTYQLVVSNAYGVAISKPAKVTIVIPLAAALDTTTLNWLTSGSSPWYGQTNYVHPVAGFVNLSAARSGGIGGSQETILQTTLVTNLPGSISFWWKVSSEQFFDTLEFRINGTVQAIISGEADWQLASFPVAAGTNVLMWRYSKDSSFDSGLDAAFVDQFSFVSAPVINVQPAGVVANLGQTVQLRVVAAGIPSPDYQWRQNGNPVGGNSSVLTLSSVARAQGGTYSVIVTNAGGMAISSNAAVVVKVPQVLSAPVLLPDGSLQLTSADANGSLLTDASLANFEAQASSDLVNWVTLTNGLSLTNGMLQLNDTARTNFTSRYYRIVEH